MTPKTLDLTADYIDVRDIIARVEELTGERDSFVIGAPDGTETEAPEQWAEEYSEDAEELTALAAILEDLKGNGGDEQWEGDWYPVTLIRDSYFETAMDDLLEDIGDMPENIPSYLKITVDYDALQQDYTSTEIDDVTYWYR